MAGIADAYHAQSSNAVKYIMKKVAILMLLNLVALTGCVHQYSMKLTNGLQVTTTSKPKLKNGVYVYKDAKGREQYMPAGRVIQIQPTSMAQAENEPFKPTISH
jgi:hypothetical protein